MDRFLRSKRLRLLVWLLAKGECQICHEPLGDDFDVDHKQRYTDGGPTRLWNLQATHPSCNRGGTTSST
jgi:5-methylcytosine-specific restriction endonuclease McrA